MHRLMRNTATGCLVLLAAACTSTPAKPSAESPPADFAEARELANRPPPGGLVCERRATVGSHLSGQDCRTPEQLRKDREEADAFIDEINRDATRMRH